MMLLTPWAAAGGASWEAAGASGMLLLIAGVDSLLIGVTGVGASGFGSELADIALVWHGTSVGAFASVAVGLEGPSLMALPPSVATEFVSEEAVDCILTSAEFSFVSELGIDLFESTEGILSVGLVSLTPVLAPEAFDALSAGSEATGFSFGKLSCFSDLGTTVKQGW